MLVVLFFNTHSLSFNISPCRRCRQTPTLYSLTHIYPLPFPSTCHHNMPRSLAPMLTQSIVKNVLQFFCARSLCIHPTHTGNPFKCRLLAHQRIMCRRGERWCGREKSNIAAQPECVAPMPKGVRVVFRGCFYSWGFSLHSYWEIRHFSSNFPHLIKCIKSNLINHLLIITSIN